MENKDFLFILITENPQIFFKKCIYFCNTLFIMVQTLKTTILCSSHKICCDLIQDRMCIQIQKINIYTLKGGVNEVSEQHRGNE